MGRHLYPVLDRKVAGVDLANVNGKVLAHAVYEWSIPALSVLAEFYSADPHDDAHMLGYFLPDEANPNPEYTPAPPDFPFLHEEWHEAALGLSVVREALKTLEDLQHLVNPRFEKAEVCRELLAVEVILTAQRQKARASISHWMSELRAG